LNADSEGAKPSKLLIGHDIEKMARHYSVTGKVLKVPERLAFHGNIIDKFKEHIGPNRSYAERVMLSEMNDASLSIDVECELEAGDKVWFDYLAQIASWEEMLIVDVEGYGQCFFVRYDQFYCAERNGEIHLLNGYVWIEKVKKADKTDMGLLLSMNE